MEYSIWKHELPLKASLRQHKAIPVPMPKNAELLGIGVQDDVPMVWEKHPVHGENEIQQAMWFRLVMTGEPFDGAGKYLGTLLLHGGEFVVHVYLHQETV